MIYRYLRFSTSYQDERQQENTINNYLASKNMVADATITDAGISGGISYKKRNLFELCNELKPNDIVIVSEVSRLTRSGIGELSEIIEKYFKPNKLRLIICNVGLDVDCSDLNPMIEMQLMMMATFAKIEKSLICQRTKSALEARKKNNIAIGGTNELWGKNTKTDRRLALQKAHKASALARKKKAIENPNNKSFWEFIEDYQEINGKITANTDFKPISEKLNQRGKKTSTGLEFTPTRAKAMYNSLKNIYSPCYL